MEEGNGDFRLNPNWEPIANDKDVLGMANAMYADLKQHMFSGVMIPQESISQLMYIVKKVLYADFGWNKEELEALNDKFVELNKYYPEEVEGNPEIPSAALMVAPNLIPSGIMHRMGNVHMEVVKNKRDKSDLLRVKEIVIGLVEIVVCCLAIIGLLALIGLL